jgi:hypothetical protein
MTNDPAQHAIDQAIIAGRQLATYPPAVPPRQIGLIDNLAGSLAVDTWLKVKPYGMTIGKDTTTLFKKLPFEIDLATVQYCRRIRFGNPAEYRITYDGVNDSRGGLWAETAARAKAIDPKCQGDYRSADIALAATEDIVAENGTVLVERGKKVGYALPVTGWNSWADLIRRLMQAGLNPELAVIRVTVSVQHNRNASGEWGTLLFESFEAAA